MEPLQQASLCLRSTRDKSTLSNAIHDSDAAIYPALTLTFTRGCIFVRCYANEALAACNNNTTRPSLVNPEYLHSILAASSLCTLPWSNDTCSIVPTLPSTCVLPLTDHSRPSRALPFEPYPQTISVHRQVFRRCRITAPHLLHYCCSTC